MKLVYDKSVPGRRALRNIPSGVPVEAKIKPSLLRKAPAELPELSELDVVRHFTALSNRNFGVDSGFYPLGSCTMKYNPRINEAISRMPGLTEIHPAQPDLQVQGALRLLWELQEALKKISGMAGVTLQPAAGAHGELTAMLMTLKPR